MKGYTLQLLEDCMNASQEISLSLRPQYRVVYVVEGSITITSGDRACEFSENSAWFGTGECSLKSISGGTRVWRWELVKTCDVDGDAISEQFAMSRLVQVQDLDLDSQVKYLMRCDRVDFPLGGIAYTHTHPGPGIRCLLSGEIFLRVHDRESVIEPGTSWFERGPDPVLARASKTHLTSFVRTMFLPRALKGKSSIQYTNSDDEDKPKRQQYTRFVDEFIDL